MRTRDAASLTTDRPPVQADHFDITAYAHAHIRTVRTAYAALSADTAIRGGIHPLLYDARHTYVAQAFTGKHLERGVSALCAVQQLRKGQAPRSHVYSSYARNHLCAALALRCRLIRTWEDIRSAQHRSTSSTFPN